MQFYSKAALQLVYDQVNRDNPGLPAVLSPDNAAITTGPTAVSVGQFGRNTRATFTAKPGTGVQGNAVLYYDRIDLTSMFPFNPVVYLKSSITTVKAALPYLNDALGITLSESDIVGPDTAITPPNATVRSLTLTVAATSPAFLGKLTFSYQIKSSGFYPNSGPGPKNLLQGNTAMGYFGTVDAKDLFTHAELSALAFLKGTKPVLLGDTEGWYKFYYNGKIIYLPITPLGNTVSWNTLYSEGLVYGTDDNGKYPAATPVNQSRIVTRDSASGGRSYFRIRLPSVGVDPMPAGTPPDSNISGSELQMFNYLRNGTWASLTGSWWTQWMITQNTVSTAVANSKIVTLSIQSWTQVPKTDTSTGWYWFPVLELVDKSNTLLGLESVFGKMDSTLTPIVFDIQNSLQVQPLVPGIPKTIDFLPITFDIDQSLAVKPLNPGAPKTIDFRPIPFKTEIYSPSKIDLGSTSGELDDF